MKKIITLFNSLRKNTTFLQQFKNIKCKNKYRKAKQQEQLIINYSNGLFSRLNNEYNSITFDSELDLKFGDMIDNNGNYYDLKVGEHYTGAINKRSIENFGNTTTNRHWYICTNLTLSKIYIINARELYQLHLENKLIYRTGDDEYIGEKDYIKYPFTIKLEENSL